MKVPKERQSATVPATCDPCEPAGTLQRRVDQGPRQQAQRDRLTQLQADGNRNGLPPSLRSGIESLSGLDMGDVRVHRNSAKPAQLQAHAYAQGSDIYLAPGQEKHLPHEAWHVVQQKQGRVQPTCQMKQGAAINDDNGLEHEADVMGARAMQPASLAITMKRGQPHEPWIAVQQGQAPVQRVGTTSLLNWGGAGLALAGLTGIAGAVGSGVPLGLGLLGGGVAMLLGGQVLGGGQESSSGYGTRPRSNIPTDPDWYRQRAKTAYGYTTGLGYQGPHTVPHIGKRVAAENAIALNPDFDPVAISQRTGVIPSAGQARRLVREFEEQTGTKISDVHKKKLDEKYKDALDRRDTGTHEERVRATREAMEMNPLATYSLHQKASHSEIKGKGERRHTVRPDLEKMSKMKKGDPMPSLAMVDLPSTPTHRTAHMLKLLRDTGQIFKGNDDISEFELSSDDEY